MGRRGYSGYHGKATVRDVLKLIAALLAVLLVLAAAGLMFGQRYIIYTDDGVRLELPFFRREEASASTPSVDPDVVQLPRPEPEELPEELPKDESPVSQP